MLNLLQDAKQDNVYQDNYVNKNAVDSDSFLDDILLKHRSSSSINCQNLILTSLLRLFCRFVKQKIKKILKNVDIPKRFPYITAK